jgi:lipopolysaccharide/colanic/teichoic acid biosynthesis glycosyltransferase
MAAPTAQDAAARRSGQIGARIAGESLLAGSGSSRQHCVKRCFDVIASSILIVVVTPLLIVIALAVLLDDGRPVLYRQERVGARPRRGGGRVRWSERRFRIVKFRTMVRDADAGPVHEDFVAAFVRGEGQLDGDAKLSDDARVTGVGRILRATSLDELPQLFNVLAGSMSMVGPRPVPAYEVALYEPRHRERLAARPGITGSWQVDGRGRVNFEEMVRLDTDYVRRPSLWRDLVLLVRTIPAVWRRHGAR